MGGEGGETMNVECKMRNYRRVLTETRRYGGEVKGDNREEAQEGKSSPPIGEDVGGFFARRDTAQQRVGAAATELRGVRRS